jgi:MFS family permease
LAEAVRIEAGEGVAPAPAADPVEAEAAFERFVWDNLPRNFAGHFMHGMLGMTGFRIFNAPTILPVYLHLITGSPFLVGVGQTMQQLGAIASPIVGAAAVEHRRRVLPVSMWMGTLMRVQMVAIALAAWFLKGPALVATVMGCLLLLGLFQGAQGVAFQMLLAKVIPTTRRGILQALRNTFGGVVAALLAFSAGTWLIGHNVLGNGYAVTFLASAILTSLGLTALALLMREPEAPVVRERSRVVDRVRQFPALLAADRGYMYFMIAQTCATAGRIGVPFYALFAAHVMPITGPHGGANVGLMSVMLLGGDAASNIVWGLLGDRFGFRSTFIGCLALWIAATLALILAGAPPMVLAAFAGLGAAQSGFQMSSQTMVLEFGARHDMPMRLGLSQTAQGLMNTVGPLAGGAIVVFAGYVPLFIASMVFEAAALVLLLTVVDEPRLRRRDA